MGDLLEGGPPRLKPWFRRVGGVAPPHVVLDQSRDACVAEALTFNIVEAAREGNIKNGFPAVQIHLDGGDLKRCLERIVKRRHTWNPNSTLTSSIKSTCDKINEVMAQAHITGKHLDDLDMYHFKLDCKETCDWDKLMEHPKQVIVYFPKKTEYPATCNPNVFQTLQDAHTMPAFGQEEGLKLLVVNTWGEAEYYQLTKAWLGFAIFYVVDLSLWVKQDGLPKPVFRYFIEHPYYDKHPERHHWKTEEKYDELQRFELEHQALQRARDQMTKELEAEIRNYVHGEEEAGAAGAGQPVVPAARRFGLLTQPLGIFRDTALACGPRPPSSPPCPLAACANQEPSSAPSRPAELLAGPPGPAGAAPHRPAAGGATPVPRTATYDFIGKTTGKKVRVTGTLSSWADLKAEFHKQPERRTSGGVECFFTEVRGNCVQYYRRDWEEGPQLFAVAGDQVFFHDEDRWKKYWSAKLVVAEAE